MAVKFYLDKRANPKTGEVSVRVSIYIKAVRIISTLGYNVAPDSWIASEEKVVSTYKNSKGATAKMINNRIKAIRSYFDAMDLVATEKPTQQELTIALSKITGSTRGQNIAKADNKKKEEPTALFYFEEFVREESQRCQWSAGTLECWNAFRHHLKAQGDGILLSHFTEQNIEKFIDYLRKTKQMEEKTVDKHFKNLRWFLNWAINKGYCTELAIQRVKPKFKLVAKPVIFLTKDELLKLYRFEVPENGTKVKLRDINGEEYEKVVSNAGALAKTRDLFCFCAFTSLRYSDMAKLKRTDISDGILNITTKKTNDRLSIILNDYAKAILDKYKDERYIDNLALPVISNQKMNDYIKDICELCEFDEPITRVCFRGGEREEVLDMKWQVMGTHAARRTFICYALAEGIPPEVVMKFTGHSDYKAMKPYIDVSEDTKQEAMAVFNKGLNK